MKTLNFDKEAAQKLLAVYTTPDVVQQRQEFLDALQLQVGQRVLDVGSGPGFLANSMAQQVGPTGAVCGIDISEYLIQVAKKHNEGLPNVTFSNGNATQVDFPDEAFDQLVCTQVLEYVPDVDAALKEFNRVLKKGGKVAILDTDWDSIVWNTADRARMAKVLKAWEAHNTDPFLPKTLSNKLIKAGFQIEAIKIIPICNPVYDPNTYSNRMMDLIVPFVLKNSTISQEEIAAWSEELKTHPDYFFSLNRYLFIGIK